MLDKDKTGTWSYLWVFVPNMMLGMIKGHRDFFSAGSHRATSLLLIFCPREIALCLPSPFCSHHQFPQGLRKQDNDGIAWEKQTAHSYITNLPYPVVSRNHHGSLRTDGLGPLILLTVSTEPTLLLEMNQQPEAVLAV